MSKVSAESSLAGIFSQCYESSHLNICGCVDWNKHVECGMGERFDGDEGDIGVDLQ